MRNSVPVRDAFTMVELLAVVAIIGVLVGLLLPAVQSAREGARRTSCSNNLMQIGIAAQSYHAAFDQFPVQLSGTDGSTVEGRDNDRRLSVFVALLPFLNQQVLTDSIATPQSKSSSGGYDDMMGMSMDMDMGMDDVYWDEELGDWATAPEDSGEDDASEGEQPALDYLAGGPEPFQKDYLPWSTEVPTLRCPSDPGWGDPAMARSNYAVSLGDGIEAINTGPMKSVQGVFVIDPQLQTETGAAMRGVFVPRTVTRRADIVDGIAHTLLFAEIATDLGDRDIRTNAAIGPANTVLRDNPDWTRRRDLTEPERPMFWRTGTKTLSAISSKFGRGYRWADGMPLFTGVNNILAPNSSMILGSSSDDSAGIFPASSRHQGGANVCLADGAIRFISDSIDAGDPAAKTPYFGSQAQNNKSPYGIWGALSTRASGELVQADEEF